MLILGSIQQLLVTCAMTTSWGQFEVPQLRSAESTVVRSATGNIELTMSMTPIDLHPDGPELAYEIDYRNVSDIRIVDLTIQNTIPESTQFRVGSTTAGKPPESISSVRLLYSADGGTTWDYQPVSGGGGAPANYDANVTHVRFMMTGNLMPGVASAHGVGFSVRATTH